MAMKLVHIYIEQEQRDALDQMSKDTGEPVAKLVREAINMLIAKTNNPDKSKSESVLELLQTFEPKLLEAFETWLKGKKE